MNAERLSLTRLLSLNDKEKSLEVWSKADSGKEHLLARVSVPWQPLKERLMERLAEQLDTPLMDLCVAGWKKVEEMRQFADRTQYPRHEKHRVALVAHDIASDCQPTLEVSLGPHRFPPVRFTLHVSVRLEGCVLTIAGGRIIAILPGTCEGEATLTYSDVDLAKAHTEKVNLGPEYSLSEGISLGVDDKNPARTRTRTVRNAKN